MKKFLGVLILAALIPVSAHANYTSTINATISIWTALTVGSTQMVFPTIKADHFTTGGATIATTNTPPATPFAGLNSSCATSWATYQTGSDFTVGNNLAVAGSNGKISVTGGTTGSSVKITAGPTGLTLANLPVILCYTGAAQALVGGATDFVVSGSMASGGLTAGNYSATSTAFTVAYN